MRMIAASEREVQRARAGPVARERALAGQKPAVLDSSHACADDFRPQTGRIMLHQAHRHPCFGFNRPLPLSLL
jgi:hypothetical protein